jgi:hypothetical protein
MKTIKTIKERNDIDVITGSIVEPPALVLRSCSYNGAEPDFRVTWAALRSAQVGECFGPSSTGCGRAVFRETATVVFRNQKGAAVVIETEITTDSPDPEDVSPAAQLHWFAFA